MQVWSGTKKRLAASGAASRRQVACLDSLVGYVAFLDSAGKYGITPPVSPGEFTLASLVSGIAYATRPGQERFALALAAVRTVIREGLAPWNLRPALGIHPEWQPFFALKQAMHDRLCNRSSSIVAFSTSIGRGLALCAPEYGVHGFLRKRGASVSLASRERGGSTADRVSSHSALPPLFAHSLSASADGSPWIQRALARLNNAEPGWGGPSHGAIIASPFQGSVLHPADIIKIAEGTL